MTPGRRWSKTITIDGIRSRNPQLSEAEVHQAWLRILHGALTDKYLGARASGSS